MLQIIDHEIKPGIRGDVLVLYLDPMTAEFAEEFGHPDGERGKSLRENAEQYIRQKLPGLRVTAIKVMAGSMLVTTLLMSGAMASRAEAATLPVQQTITVSVNGLPQNLSQPAVARNGTTYIPVRDIAEALGAEVWWNEDSQTVGINKGDTRIAFVIGSASARVNGVKMAMQPSYVAAGRTMVPVRFLAEAMGARVSWNGDTQTVSISTGEAPATDVNSVTIQNYKVQSGDNVWSLSIRFGIPMAELLKENNMTMNSMLTVGQTLRVPVHHIAVQQTVSPRHGEYLDWWTEAQYLYTINKVATVTDFQTGKSFKVKRTIGANHADCEPMTAEDARIMKEVWGGAYSWVARAVIVNVDGRKIAASMTSMNHSIEYIMDNNFKGHFDIHFRNSTRHNDGLVDSNHRRQVQIAAGVTGG